MKIKTSTLAHLFLGLLPIGVALWIWFSPLAFIPIPWPDDAAFYFVAKHLFQWPPRWVMLSQAPFEPTYAIFNFNTMPLYPILIGLGRWIGIDGSFLLKFWPLTAWALTGSVLATTLYRKGLHFGFALLISLFFAFNPVEHWASVLIRPESLIGLFGMILVLQCSFNANKKSIASAALRPERWYHALWDPTSALLALAAYSHFNAIHLVFPVIIAWLKKPKKLLQIASLTALYLSPWLIAILLHFNLFITQMTLQWNRLDIPNSGLNSYSQAIASLFQNLGSPIAWPTQIVYASLGLWLIFITALFYAGIQISKKLISPLFPAHFQAETNDTSSINLLPSIAWLLSSLWIWYSKPEVWFIYYFHVALCCFSGLFLIKNWKQLHTTQAKSKILSTATLTLFSLVIITISTIFIQNHLTQIRTLNPTHSWHWSTYSEWLDCIDHQLIQQQKHLSKSSQQNQARRNSPFRVWNPTPPDISIELSLRHPDWEFTRTNDFNNRSFLALQHGWQVDAVVVTETFGQAERNIAAQPSKEPGIQSRWMNWRPYFLYQLLIAPKWKPNRFICQKGRWQAFLYMEN